MQEFYGLITKLYHEGKTDKQIGEVVGVSHSHIRDIRRFKLNLSGQREIKREERHKLIKELYDQGYNDTQISRILGISNSAVQWNRKNKMRLDTLHIERTYETQEDRIRGYMIRNIKGASKRRGIEFDLDYRDLTLVDKCPLLDIPLKCMTEKGFNDNDRATVDRIDNSRGYVKGNVWIISRLANAMKNEASLDQLEFFSKKVLEMIENHRALGGITDSESLDP